MTKQLKKPPVLAALDHALSAHGVSPLDPDVPASVWRRALTEPAAEFLARPGKRLRTGLVEAAFRLAGGTGDPPSNVALVVELLHAGSLIIDDVQDEAVERRGGPALHRLVGVPLAINTGSWLYFWALAEIAELNLPAHRELSAHRLVARTLVRCHQGQALDLATRITELAQADARAVVAATTRLKTGTLCRFAMELGALAGGASEEVCETLGGFGESAGSALQMLDDLGSLIAPDRRAKAREDLRGGRPTWPWAWIAEHDPATWDGHLAKARAVISGHGDLDLLAGSLADHTASTGRQRIRSLLDSAVGSLAAALGAHPVIDHVAGELRHMETRYGC